MNFLWSNTAFNTNNKSSVLPTIGPVSLFINGHKKPCIHFLPIYFLLSKIKDDEFFSIFFRKYIQIIITNGIKFINGHFNYFVINLARIFFGNNNFNNPYFYINT